MIRSWTAALTLWSRSASGRSFRFTLAALVADGAEPGGADGWTACEAATRWASVWGAGAGVGTGRLGAGGGAIGRSGAGAGLAVSGAAGSGRGAGAGRALGAG